MKCRNQGLYPILLLALLALTTSTYTSLGVSQDLNPRPQLFKASVYHSATSAVCCLMWVGGCRRLRDRGVVVVEREGSGNYGWIRILDGPLLDSAKDYGKCNILFLQFLYLSQFLCVGIVQFDEIPLSSNIQKEHHHGGAI
jgi:hypothetical protein